MVHFESNIGTSDMIGEWYLAATTLGNFNARPRVEEATLTFIQASEATHFTLRFRTPRRAWNLRGTVPDRTRKVGRHHWRGFGAWLPASRLAWGLSRSKNGLVVAAHSPGSMMTNEGIVLLAKAGTPHSTVEATIRRDHCVLGLAGRELEDLHWRIGSQRDELTPSRAQVRREAKAAASVRQEPALNS